MRSPGAPLRMRPLGGVARARTAWAPFATAAAQRPAIPLFYNDLYEVPLPSKHRFPMRKYRLVRQGLERELTPQGFADFEPSPLVTLDDLVTTHCREYASRYVEGRMSVSENRRVGFPWSDASVRRSLSSTGGTVAAARAVCDGRSAIAGHIAGGTHHAFFDRGEGFCVFNDIAVAANVALRDYGTWLRRILVIDLDVHQGNGTARLFASEPRVFTFSLHCAANFFSKRETSDRDVEIPAGASDEPYVAALERELPSLFATVQPQLVFFQAGVDPHESDAFGKLCLSSAGLKRRNALVFSHAREAGARVVVTMGGGYPRDLAPDSVAYGNVVQAHMDVYRAAASANRQRHPLAPGR